MPTQRRAPVKRADDTDDAAPVATVSATEPLPALKDDDSSLTTPRIRKTALPVALQFPLLATLSFVMASLGYSLLGEVTKGELAGVSRSQDTWEEVAVLAGWRGLELAIAWFGNLDSLDAAALNVLSHGPHFYLLSTFYGLSISTAASALAIDTLSAAVPFFLLRPLSVVHSPSSPAAAKLPNRELLDVPLQLYTAALSTGIYTVVLFLALRFALPSVLVVYFAGLPTLAPAYAASYAALLPTTALLGAAASTFIFAPFATTGPAREDEQIGRFDPVAASLGQTLRWNIWGYTARTKVVVRRTGVAVLASAVNTFLAASRTVAGVEAAGAAWYAGVWAVAALCTGVGLGFVGGEL